MTDSQHVGLSRFQLFRTVAACVRLGERDSSFVSLASPLRVADSMHVCLIIPPISRGLCEICGRLMPRVYELTGGDWCKFCGSYNAYLRMLPSIPPARGARKVSHAYLVKTRMIICIRYSGLKGKALTIKYGCSVLCSNLCLILTISPGTRTRAWQAGR